MTDQPMNPPESGEPTPSPAPKRRGRPRKVKPVAEDTLFDRTEPVAAPPPVAAEETPVAPANPVENSASPTVSPSPAPESGAPERPQQPRPTSRCQTFRRPASPHWRSTCPPNRRNQDRRPRHIYESQLHHPCSHRWSGCLRQDQEKAFLRPYCSTHSRRSSRRLNTYTSLVYLPARLEDIF